MEKKKKIKFLISFVLVSIFFISLPSIASAANLYFSPSSGDYKVGKTFSVSVYVSSANQAINAASGIVSYPADKLEVTSLSKAGSIFTLWVSEPSFSNSAGTVNFEGIVLNPGFTGSSGKVITITFKTKIPGNAPLTFSSGSALANDGKGTNVLTSMGKAQFSLGGATTTVPSTTTITTTPIISGTPSLPKISSPTHPDSDKWYSKKDAQFTWSVPSGVTSVRLLVNKSATSTPTTVYTPATSGKEITNLSDGIGYFHAQFRNAKGWGGIAHFKFQIDTKSPEPIAIKFVHGNQSIDPSPIITFNTTDSLSGMNYYQIKIGSGGFINIDPKLIISNPYSLPTQEPGKNTIVVQAYDKAGNSITEVEEFEILALEPPKITRYSKNIVQGDLLEIGGKTYPDSDVDLFLLQEDKKILEQRVKSNSSGDFTFIWSNRLENGVYNIQAQVTDNRGAKSLLSEKITIVVTESQILKIGSWAINLLAVLVPLIVLIFALLFILLYGRHKFLLLRRRLRKEVREAESTLHKAFDLLKDDIREQVKMLEKTSTKRELTLEEDKILKKLKNHLDDTEKFIRKEIENIEKEVK